MIGYWIDSTNDEYYEGERRNMTDEEVTPRSNDLLDWISGEWVYNLDRCKAEAKRVFSLEINTRIDELFAAVGMSVADIAMASSIAAECNFLADNPTATDDQLPILAGWVSHKEKADPGFTKADAAALDAVAELRTCAFYLGAFMAYKDTCFSAINAATDGVSAMAIVFNQDDI